MRLFMSGLSGAAILALLEGDRRLASLLALARQQGAGLRRLEEMVHSGADHAPATSIAASRAMFDRLVEISPEASVAAYSLGDPALLEAASTEITGWLLGVGLLEHRPRILDLGCGIGRIAQALAPHARSILGLDVSRGMIEAARRRCNALPHLEFVLTSGHGMDELPAGGFDLLLAVDVFPYLVQAGDGLAERHVADAGRLLRPGGNLVILNFSYRGIQQDRIDLRAMAAQHGFTLLREGTREFKLWDADAFWLSKPDGLASGAADAGRATYLGRPR
ncbi:methyltransferase domain-containing protein [Roseococcus sp. YIM B11640]|uniref:class I SAM-dependent methyltransferase n=1 Tax=Roseococcus sp. YIM B11640 TaxID=3133973 RepID=UPI003C7D69E1